MLLLLLLLLHLLLLRMWRVGVGRVGVRVHRRANRTWLAVDSAIVLLATGVVRLPHVGTTLVWATGATPALRAGPWRGPRRAGHGLFDVTVCIWTTIWHHILEPHPLLLLHVAGAHLRWHLTSRLAWTHHGSLLPHHGAAGGNLLETLTPWAHRSTRSVHEPHVWTTLSHLTHHVWHILTLRIKPCHV